LDICPQREFDPNKGCGVRKNQCCKNSDCDNPRYFCCIDYCGNRCKSYKLGDAKEKKYQYHSKMSYPFITVFQPVTKEISTGVWFLYWFFSFSGMF
ncbi:hypothetical protein AVEN_275134-1, partial [Araneus ventricosus]